MHHQSWIIKDASRYTIDAQKIRKDTSSTRTLAAKNPTYRTAILLRVSTGVPTLLQQRLYVAVRSLNERHAIEIVGSFLQEMD